MDETAGCELVRVLPNCEAETTWQGLCLDALNLFSGTMLTRRLKGTTVAGTMAGSPSQHHSHPTGAWIEWEVDLFGH